MINERHGNCLENFDPAKLTVIAHVVNNIGVMGAGIAYEIKKNWPVVYEKYISLLKRGKENLKGECQSIFVNENLTVCNLFAQDGIGVKDGRIPLQYDWLEQALKCMSMDLYLYSNVGRAFDVRMPKIGCGLAGGKWDVVRPLIEKYLSNYNVMIYNL